MATNPGLRVRSLLLKVSQGVRLPSQGFGLCLRGWAFSQGFGLFRRGSGCFEGVGVVSQSQGFGLQGEGVHRNVQRFRGGLVFKAHRLCVSLNSRLESNKEEEDEGLISRGFSGCGALRTDLAGFGRGSGCPCC